MFVYNGNVLLEGEQLIAKRGGLLEQEFMRGDGSWCIREEAGKVAHPESQERRLRRASQMLIHEQMGAGGCSFPIVFVILIK